MHIVSVHFCTVNQLNWTNPDLTKPAVDDLNQWFTHVSNTVWTIHLSLVNVRKLMYFVHCCNFAMYVIQPFYCLHSPLQTLNAFLTTMQ
jgi:hypothetical protein